MSISRFGGNQRGDTIIEVLIAIAVASAVLGTSYAIVNRTARSQQQSTEHTEALKLAEAQLESLRNVGAAGFDPDGKCFSDTGNKITNAASCLGRNPEARYDIEFSKSSDVYTVNVSWDSINNNSRDTVSLSYKVF